MAEALDGVGIIPRVQLQKALMQIKGAPVAIVNIAVTSALSLIVFRLEFQSCGLFASKKPLR